MHRSICAKYLFFLFIFYSFLFNEQLVYFVPIWQYEDEFLALLALILWVLGLIKRKGLIRLGFSIYIIAFLCCCCAGTLIYGYQSFFKAALPDFFLNSKFWLCIYLGFVVFRNFDMKKHADRIFFHIKIIAILFGGLSILNLLTGIFHSFDYRFGIGSNSLFYSHPSVLVACCSLLFVMLVAVRPYVRQSKFYMIILIFILCTTLRSKAFADAVIFVVISYFSYRKKVNLSIRHLILLAPFVIAVCWAQIDYYFIELSDDSARSQLLLTSLTVANDHFPFGAGFATYGSFFSAVYYSPLYYDYGLNTVFGLSEEFYDFMFDSFWPMILGQSGYFGLLLYLVAIYQLFKRIGLLKSTLPHCFLSALAVMGFILVDSFAASAFVHPYSLPFSIWLGIQLGSADLISRNNTSVIRN